MEGKVDFRDLAWGDFEDLVGNYYSYYEELSETPSLGLILFSEKPSRAAEMEWFANVFSGILRGEQVASVAVADGRTVGLAQVHRKGPQEDIAHVGHLGISVHRDYRGRGIGSALLADVLAKARKHFEVVELTVFRENDRARHLYEKHGFQSVGTVPRAVKRRGKYYDEELMVLVL